MEYKSSSLLLKLYTWLIGALLVLSGLVLAIGGGILITYGGSFYYLPMGVALCLAGVGLLTLRPCGLLVFLLAYLLTVLWSIWEVGFDFWPLVPRLTALTGYAALVAFTYPCIMKHRVGERSYREGYALGILLLAGMAGIFYQFIQPHYGYLATNRAPLKTILSDEALTDWQQYANTTKGTRFSGAQQITAKNIRQLKNAWIFRTGDVPENKNAGPEDQNTPLFVDNTVFICTSFNNVIAINPETGNQLWRYDSHITTSNWQRCRGLAYSTSMVMEIDQAMAENEPQMDQEKALASPYEFGQDYYEGVTSKLPVCTTRIFMNTTDDRLIALDSLTGKLCREFGNRGVVDLRLKRGGQQSKYRGPSAPPIVAGDVVVVAGGVADNYSIGEPSGGVRAYSIHDGQLVWALGTDNQDNTTTSPADKTYIRSSVNVEAAMAYDPNLDLIYVSTANATPSLRDDEQSPHDDANNASIVAIEAKTGKIRWQYQTVHHDLWSYDLPSQPLLYDIPEGESILPALIQTTKSGQIFVLNRETGKPLTTVIEKAVAQGNVQGERYAITQPLSVGMPSIGNRRLEESDMWGITPFDQLWCRIDFASMNYQGLFTPPAMTKTLQWPGSLGGMSWGGVSVDSTTDYLFVNDLRIADVTWKVADKQSSANGSGITPQARTPFFTMRNRFMSPLGLPCQAPPYGTMRAIDLKTRKVVWKVAVGTLEDTNMMGMAMQLPVPIGMPTLGSSVATQSGLLFFAGSQDFYLRAYDSYTGKEIWKYRLPVGSQGTPITFISPNNGKQYIVLTASGGGQSANRGDYVMAWALDQ